MSLKRQALCIGIAMLGLCLASAVQAKNFSIVGGGGQSHIGNGLMLPIQAAATAATTGTVFPTLLVPIVPGAKASGTTFKPLLTAMATVSGPVTKSGYQREIKLPAGVLKKSASQTTVGVKFSNPTAFAVATNVNYTWPAVPATFSTGNAVGTPIVSGFGGTMTYSNTLGSRFGGPAQFAVSGGGAGGIIPAPVTVYIKINAITPACTHNVFGGTDAGCVAGLVGALPSPALLGQGGATATTVMTPGTALAPNVAVVKMGTSPLGTILAKFPAATNTAVPTNKATSQPGPWTTGQIIITNTAADPDETFTISGKDSRTALGGGTIQLVSGSLSARNATGPNANRGWVQIEFAGPGVSATPPTALLAGAGLMVLVAGYIVRRRHIAG